MADALVCVSLNITYAMRRAYIFNDSDSYNAGLVGPQVEEHK
eukprot:COSAG01_NODE_1454_length_10256_cov_4.300748_11_plen_42_part_00